MADEIIIDRLAIALVVQMAGLFLLYNFEWLHIGTALLVCFLSFFISVNGWFSMLKESERNG